MKTVSEQIENTKILIETMDESVEVVGTDQHGRATVTTSMNERIAKAYEEAKDTIAAIALDMGKEFDSLKGQTRPKQLELEFAMGFSASAGVWVITAKGDAALKVKLIWQL
jgi:hypothetical protein